MIDIPFNWSDLIVILLTFACFGTLSGLLLFLKDRFLTPKSRPGRNSRRTAPCVPQVAEKIPAELVKTAEVPSCDALHLPSYVRKEAGTK